jgi:serine kinase of HPr protein (carbohydrate metabolism regulator)
MILHAGLIALRLGGRWRGVLIEGRSGAGKSDLALRALSAGFRLVADDRTIVWASSGALFGRAPPILAGLIEMRGQGIVREPALACAEIVLVATCADDQAEVERMPPGQVKSLCGVTVPHLTLDALALSAPARLWRAIQHLGGAAQQAYQACPLGGGKPRRDWG